MATVRSRQTKKKEALPQRSIEKVLYWRSDPVGLSDDVHFRTAGAQNTASSHLTSMSPNIDRKGYGFSEETWSDSSLWYYRFFCWRKRKFVKRVSNAGRYDVYSQRSDGFEYWWAGEFETTYTFQLSPAVAEEFQALTETWKVCTLPQGSYWCLSKDSRTFGFVQKVEGKVQFHLPLWSESRRIVNE